MSHSCWSYIAYPIHWMSLSFPSSHSNRLAKHIIDAHLIVGSNGEVNVSAKLRNRFVLALSLLFMLSYHYSFRVLKKWAELCPSEGELPTSVPDDIFTALMKEGEWMSGVMGGRNKFCSCDWSDDSACDISPQCSLLSRITAGYEFILGVSGQETFFLETQFGMEENVKVEDVPRRQWYDLVLKSVTVSLNLSIVLVVIHSQYWHVF